MLMSDVKALQPKVGDELIMESDVLNPPQTKKVVIDQRIMDYINAANKHVNYVGLIQFVNDYTKVNVPYMTHFFLERKS